MLTILWHPQLQRFGECAPLSVSGRALTLNRYTPLFGQAGSSGAPLGHASISRAPLQLLAEGAGTVRLSCPAGHAQCEIDGVPCPNDISFDLQTVERGVILCLGRVVICLHNAASLPMPGKDGTTLLGNSRAMVLVRRQVAVAAATDLPVLVLGESGTGKELVARAIHMASARAQRNLMAVNMATLSESLAVVELFGAIKGAYTGAQAGRRGLWGEAHEGTLLLDEVGDTPSSVQPMLLRALETGEFRQLGSNATQRANVRVVAATDRRLSGTTFNQPLLHRLEGLVIQTPPLRARREDLGVIIQQLLQELQVLPDWPATVPVSLVRTLCMHSWPGNVRQLRNSVRRLVVSGRAGEWPTAAELFGSTDSKHEPQTPAQLGVATSLLPATRRDADSPRKYVSPADISAKGLLSALNRTGWCLRAAALELGVSRPSLYNLIERHPQIRRAQTISRADIEAALQFGVSSIEALAARLRTPRDALRRRLRELGLTVTP
jgi:two-component system nitrogen regulation response regulator GlnG